MSKNDVSITLPFLYIFSVYIMLFHVYTDRGAIAVIHFPDYVQKMCQEDEDNNCKLLYEYRVSMHCHYISETASLSSCRSFKMYPNSLVMWLVSLRTQSTIGSRMYTHVRMIDRNNIMEAIL